MKKEEVLASLIIAIQKKFIKNSFYDDDNNLVHSDVSNIKKIIPYPDYFVPEGNDVFEIYANELKDEPDLIVTDSIISCSSDVKIEILRFKVEIWEYEENNIRVYLSIAREEGDYIWTQPITIFYKIIEKNRRQKFCYVI